MFEVAELGAKGDKSAFKKALPEIRRKLLKNQFALGKSNCSVIIVIEGVDNESKGEVVNNLNQWFDIRGLDVHAFGPKSDEEADRPRFWRYWRSLPARGRIGLFSGSWYTGMLLDRLRKKVKKSAFDTHMQRIARFEQMLAQDDTLILKFWLHMSKSSQAKRFKEIRKKGNARWQISEMDQEIHDNHGSFIKSAERAIRLTDQAHAPWIIVEATDSTHRDTVITETLITAIQQKLGANSQPAEAQETETSACVQLPDSAGGRSILDQTQLAQDEPEDYSKTLLNYQNRLNELSWRAYHQKVSLVALFEGWDAAGKGGAIRRLTQAIDARMAKVISVAAPTDEEKAHHYLWRFWRHLPRAGHFTIYDRSWYGRVLVERVEGFAEEHEWRRAYHEINDFEEQLTDGGILLLKFWIHIDPEEQLARFKLREETPYKKHKITDEDWRNREQWSAYETAINDMVIKTSTDYSPWTIIPGNSKKRARLEVLKTVCEQLENKLGDSD